MNRLLLFLGILSLVATVSAAPEICKTGAMADVVFLIDSSRAIKIHNFKKQINFISNVVHGFKHIGPFAIQVAMIQVSTQADTKLLWKLDSYGSQDALLNAIKRTKYSKGDSYLAKGMAILINKAFTKEVGGRPNVTRIAVILSNGLATDRSHLQTIMHQIKSSGIVVYTVGIGGRIDVAEIANIATDNKHVLTVADFNQLDKIVGTLRTRLCTYGHKCPKGMGWHPSLNKCTTDKRKSKKEGGANKNKSKNKPQRSRSNKNGQQKRSQHPRKQHAHGIQGVPNRRESLKLDLIIVLDATKNTGKANFQRCYKFISVLTEHYEISRDHLRIFLVLNAGAAQQYRIFSRKDTKRYLAKAHVIKYSGVKHDATDAIDLLTKRLKSKKLKRAGVRRALLFLGGVSVDRVNRAKVSTMMIKNVLTEKMLVFYLPMGSNPNVPFWNQFISEAYLLEGSFTVDEKYVVKTLKYIMGLVKNEECMPGRIPKGEMCIVKKTKGSVSKRIKEVIDVMVVLDGSAATGRKKFDQLKQFVIYLLTNYHISQKYMRVFLVSWGHRLHTYRFYGGNDQVVTAQYINTVRQILYAKSKSHVGLILGKVLEVVRDKEFLRPGVSRVILLFGALQTEGARGQQTTALVQNILSYRTFVFYLAHGKKTDNVFWKKALPVGYVFNNIQPKLIWFIKVMNTIYKVTGKKDCAKGYQLTKNRCFGKGIVNKRIKLKLNLVIIIDASVNTGKVHYAKVKQLLLYILDNYLISKEYLTMKIIYAGRKIKMMTINDTRSIKVLKKTKAELASKFPYVDATLETADAFKYLVKLSQKKSFRRKDIGTALFMMGGCRIGRDKRKKVTDMVKQLVGIKMHVYYLAYGAKTDVPFWTKAIYKYNIQTRTMGSLKWFKGFMADVMSVMKKKGCMRGYFINKKTRKCEGALNKCQHPQVWNGKRCFLRKKSRIVLDLIIVIDGSSNTGREKFNDIKRFTTLILENYVISKSALRLYVIVCGKRIHKFQFLDSQGGNETKRFVKMISELEYTGSKPDVFKMMKILHRVVGHKSMFIRPRVKRVAFLMGSFKPHRRAKTDISTELKLISSYKVFIFYLISGRRVERTFWREELHMNHIISRIRLTVQGIRSRLGKMTKAIANRYCMEGYHLKKNMCVVKLPKADTCAKGQEYDKKANRCVKAGEVNGPLAPSKDCMKLYPHKLGQGSEKIPNPSGEKWTSVLCRDYCQINPKCLAVDWKAIDRACLVHTSPFKRIKASKKYSKHPGSIAQYAKVGKCHDRRQKIELNLLLVIDASIDTGKEDFEKIQKTTRDLLEDFAIGPKKLRLEILISLAGTIKHYKFPTDTKAFGERTKFLSLVFEPGRPQNVDLLEQALRVVKERKLLREDGTKSAMLVMGAFRPTKGKANAVKTALRRIIEKKVHVLYIASHKHMDVRFWQGLIPKNYIRKRMHTTESWWNRLLRYIFMSTKKGGCMDKYIIHNGKCHPRCYKGSKWHPRKERCVAKAKPVPVARASGCMKLHKHAHALGGILISNQNGRPWTSASCRDYCRTRKKCTAVDWHGVEKKCKLHESSYTRITATAASTRHPESVVQYAKSGSCASAKAKGAKAKGKKAARGGKAKGKKATKGGKTEGKKSKTKGRKGIGRGKGGTVGAKGKAKGKTVKGKHAKAGTKKVVGKGKGAMVKRGKFKAGSIKGKVKTNANGAKGGKSKGKANGTKIGGKKGGAKVGSVKGKTAGKEGGNAKKKTAGAKDAISKSKKATATAKCKLPQVWDFAEKRCVTPPTGLCKAGEKWDVNKRACVKACKPFEKLNPKTKKCEPLPQGLCRVDEVWNGKLRRCIKKIGKKKKPNRGNSSEKTSRGKISADRKHGKSGKIRPIPIIHALKKQHELLAHARKHIKLLRMGLKHRGRSKHHEALDHIDVLNHAMSLVKNGMKDLTDKHQHILKSVSKIVKAKHGMKPRQTSKHGVNQKRLPHRGAKLGGKKITSLKHGAKKTTQVKHGAKKTMPMKHGAKKTTPVRTTPVKHGVLKTKSVTHGAKKSKYVKHWTKKVTSVKHGPKKTTPVKHGTNKTTQVKHGAKKTTSLQHGATKTTLLKHGAKKTTQVKHGAKKTSSVRHGAKKTTLVKHGAKTSLMKPKKTTPVKHGTNKTTQVKHGAKKTTSLQHGATKTTLLKHGAKKTTQVKHGAKKTTSVKHGAKKTTSVKHGAKKTTPVKHGALKTKAVKPGAKKTTPVMHGAKRTMPVKQGVMKTTAVKHGAKKTTSVKHGAKKTTPVKHGAKKTTLVRHGAKKTTLVKHGAKKTTSVKHGAKKTTSMKHGAKKTTSVKHGSKEATALMHGAKRTMPVMHEAKKITQLKHGAKKTMPVMHEAKKTTSVMHGAKKKCPPMKTWNKIIGRCVKLRCIKPMVWNREKKICEMQRCKPGQKWIEKLKKCLSAVKPGGKTAQASFGKKSQPNTKASKKHKIAHGAQTKHIKKGGRYDQTKSKKARTFGKKKARSEASTKHKIGHGVKHNEKAGMGRHGKKKSHANTKASEKHKSRQKNGRHDNNKSRQKPRGYGQNESKTRSRNRQGSTRKHGGERKSDMPNKHGSNGLNKPKPSGHGRTGKYGGKRKSDRLHKHGITTQSKRNIESTHDSRQRPSSREPGERSRESSSRRSEPGRSSRKRNSGEKSRGRGEGAHYHY